MEVWNNLELGRGALISAILIAALNLDSGWAVRRMGGLR
jgi:hypothetical protein